MEVVLQNAQMDVQNHVLRVAWNIVKEHAKAIVKGVHSNLYRELLQFLFWSLYWFCNCKKQKGFNNY